jgi:hypothetical protein
MEVVRLPVSISLSDLAGSQPSAARERAYHTYISILLWAESFAGHRVIKGSIGDKWAFPRFGGHSSRFRWSPRDFSSCIGARKDTAHRDVRQIEATQV